MVVRELSAEDVLEWHEQPVGSVRYHRLLVEMVGGDLIAGILLSRIVYWHGSEDGWPRLQVKRDGHYWLTRSRDDWWEECCATARQADRGLRLLKDLGIIETRVWKLGRVPLTHIRIVWGTFLPLFEQTWRACTGK
jgi:hypothetical protein